MTETVIPNTDSKVNSELPFSADFDIELPEDLSSFREEDQPIEDAPPKEKKLKLKDLHQQTVDTMLGLPSPWPAFHAKFHKIMDQHGVCQYLMENENKTVRHVQTTLIEQEIRRFWAKVLPEHSIFLPTLAAEDATKTRRLWEQCADPLEEEPLPISWKDQKGLAYERLPFNPQLPKDFDPDTHIPYYAEFLSRCENWHAVAAFIGSIMDHKSQRQQYVWMYGKGGEGKSSFIKGLTKRLGSSACSQEPPSKNGDKFWTSNIIAKRFVVFADIADTSFVTSGLFKSLTGEDPIRIEQKGKQAYTAELNCKFFFLSNAKPQIGNNRADLRRIIYCPVREIENMLPNYEETLDKEFSTFLSFCWKTYQDTVEGNPRKPIPSDESWAQDLASDSEEYFQSVFDRFFAHTRDPEHYVETADISERLSNVKNFSKYDDQRFKEWITTLDGVEKKRKKNGRSQYRIYTGIAAKA